MEASTWVWPRLSIQDADSQLFGTAAPSTSDALTSGSPACALAGRVDRGHTSSSTYPPAASATRAPHPAATAHDTRTSARQDAASAQPSQASPPTTADAHPAAAEWPRCSPAGYAGWYGAPERVRERHGLRAWPCPSAVYTRRVRRQNVCQRVFRCESFSDIGHRPFFVRAKAEARSPSSRR